MQLPSVTSIGRPPTNTFLANTSTSLENWARVFVGVPSIFLATTGDFDSAGAPCETETERRRMQRFHL